MSDSPDKLRIPSAFFGKTAVVKRNLMKVARHYAEHGDFPADFLDNCILVEDHLKTHPKARAIFNHSSIYFERKEHCHLHLFYTMMDYAGLFSNDSSKPKIGGSFLFDILVGHPWGTLVLLSDSAFFLSFSHDLEKGRLFFSRFLEDFPSLKINRSFFETEFGDSSEKSQFWNLAHNKFFSYLVSAGVPLGVVNNRPDNWNSDEEAEDWIRTYILNDREKADGKKKHGG